VRRTRTPPRRILPLTLAVLSLLAGSANAQTRAARDRQLALDVGAVVDRYPQYTIFDHVSGHVENGIVTLTGKVTMPNKQMDIRKRVSKLDGVKEVHDRISVLPVSGFDDELRVRIARAIYGDSNFWQYAIMPNPPIHIVVERGRVTLTGVVRSEVDRALARSLASQFGVMSVTNDLKTHDEIFRPDRARLPAEEGEESD
jgi:hyperosmotically inducible protein